MNDSHDCVDCRYHSKGSFFTRRCKMCRAIAGNPNFKPKLEETMKNEDIKPTLGRTYDYDEIVPATGSRKTVEQEETMKNQDPQPTLCRTFDYDEPVPTPGSRKTVDQEARELLTRMGITDVDTFTAGELAELAELISDSRELKRLKSIKMAEEMAPVLSATDAVAKVMDYSSPLYDSATDAVAKVMGYSHPLYESATDAVAKIMDYSHPLYEAFDDAVTQATKGKGKRHGGDKTPFMEQPWYQIAKHTGVGGLIYQMAKKAQEACGKDDQEAFERELLGALVYGGAAYLYVKKHGFKK